MNKRLIGIILAAVLLVGVVVAAIVPKMSATAAGTAGRYAGLSRSGGHARARR